MSPTIFKWIDEHKPHLAASVVLALLLVPALWFTLAYGGLPRFWSHHEHKKGRVVGDAVAYTAQDIPGDPINLKIDGSGTAIEGAMQRGGWIKADDVSLASGLQLGMSVILDRPYPNAPVSPLYLHDNKQDLAYQLDEGHSADRRHHVRFWHVAPDHWYASATFDRGVGLSLYTLQITHHIGPDVDRERNEVARILANGRQLTFIAPATIWTGRIRRNGGGDKYLSDGKIAQVDMANGEP